MQTQKSRLRRRTYLPLAPPQRLLRTCPRSLLPSTSAFGTLTMSCNALVEERGNRTTGRGAAVASGREHSAPKQNIGEGEENERRREGHAKKRQPLSLSLSALFFLPFDCYYCARCNLNVDAARRDGIGKAPWGRRRRRFFSPIKSNLLSSSARAGARTPLTPFCSFNFFFSPTPPPLPLFSSFFRFFFLLLEPSNYPTATSLLN